MKEVEKYLNKILNESTESQFKKDDKVKYSVKFLRSIGDYTKLGHARGKVITTKEFYDGKYLVTVDWNNPDIPKKVLDKNLVKIDNPEHSEY
jgi:hypothetical protein